MNEIYKNDEPYEQLAEKLGCKSTKKVLVYLFGQNYQMSYISCVYW
jgi:hypothetical protein